MSAFSVGDKVRIPYISDSNPHNDKVGVISWLHPYFFYPNGDVKLVQEKIQAQITYEDGTTEWVSDLYRKGSGLVSPVLPA